MVSVRVRHRCRVRVRVVRVRVRVKVRMHDKFRMHVLGMATQPNRSELWCLGEALTTWVSVLCDAPAPLVSLLHWPPAREA